MSLLLDALKKAEQAKRNPSPSAEAMTLADPPIESPERAPVAGVAPGPTLGAARRVAEQDAARALFTNKQPTVQNRPMWLLVGGVALLAIAGGTFWLWYTLSYPSTPAVAPAAQVPAPRPPATPIVTTNPEPRPALTAGAAEATAAPATPTQSDQTVVAPQPRSKVARPAAPSSPVVARRAVPEVTRTERPLAAVSPELAEAYGALVRGDFVTAEHQYKLVLANDPVSLDAYLGLATAAASTGNDSGAQAYYRRALEIDPKNPVASAGLAALQGDINVSEGQLRAQIAAQPNAPAPYAALGHAYASQSRWNDAQQAFFQAYRLDPGNPDYAFNLAVSLDQLKQGKLAREYYSRALSLAVTRPAAFDLAEVRTRTSQLAP